MSAYVPCQQCGTPDPERVKFTWWGGVIGPKILSHVKCRNCGTAYNGKSGKSNTQGIVIYSVLVMGLAFVILFLVFFGVALMPYLTGKG